MTRISIHKVGQNRLFTLIAAGLLILSPAFGDGGFFTSRQVGEGAQSPSQRALIIHDGQRQTLLLQVKFQGNVDEFAWIVPLPSLPDPASLTTVNDSIFTQLHDWTQPRVYFSNGRSKGAYDNGADTVEATPVPGSVTLWSTQSVGPYSIQVVSGSNAQHLQSWLESQGFVLTGGESTIDFYVQKQWVFLAVRASMLEKGNSSYQAGLPALKLAFDTPKPVFPLRISNISSSDENQIELYVASAHRVVCEHYRCAEVDQNKAHEAFLSYMENQRSPFLGLSCACDVTESPLEENFDYESFFRSDLARQSGPAFLVEAAFAGYTSYDPATYPQDGTLNGFFNSYFHPGTAFFVTRLRTILGPEDMIDDVLFHADPRGDEHFEIGFMYFQPSNPWISAVFGIVLLPWILPGSIRRKLLRKWYVGVFLLALILI